MPEDYNEETVALDPVSDDLSADSDSSAPDPVESTEDSDSVVVMPGDYLDVQTFNDGIDTVLSAISGDTDEVLSVSSYSALSTDADLDLPYNAVTYTCNGVDIFFPSSYADDLFLQDDQLINLGSSYSFGVVLGSSFLSNYVCSEVTVPTYHSPAWYQYLTVYGQPYRVVDRYISSSGSYSSYTRTSVDLSFSGGNDWAGFGYGLIFLFVIVFLLIIREVRTWLNF